LGRKATTTEVAKGEKKTFGGQVANTTRTWSSSIDLFRAYPTTFFRKVLWEKKLWGSPKKVQENRKWVSFAKWNSTARKHIKRKSKAGAVTPSAVGGLVLGGNPHLDKPGHVKRKKGIKTVESILQTDGIQKKRKKGNHRCATGG